MIYTIIENLIHFPFLLHLLYITSILLGILVIVYKNPVVSILLLIGLFSTIAIYLIYLSLSFIGLAYLLVYVGAISMLFLFILMLINIRISELTSNTKNSILLLLLTVLLFSAGLTYILPYEFNNYYINIFISSSNYWDDSLVGYNNIISLGNIMYAVYCIWLLLVSSILLLAMVGAIIITLSPRALNYNSSLTDNKLIIQSRIVLINKWIVRVKVSLNTQRENTQDIIDSSANSDISDSSSDISESSCSMPESYSGINNFDLTPFTRNPVIEGLINRIEHTAEVNRLTDKLVEISNLDISNIIHAVPTNHIPYIIIIAKILAAAPIVSLPIFANTLLPKINGAMVRIEQIIKQTGTNIFTNLFNALSSLRLKLKTSINISNFTDIGSFTQNIFVGMMVFGGGAAVGAASAGIWLPTAAELASHINGYVDGVSVSVENVIEWLNTTSVRDFVSHISTNNIHMVHAWDFRYTEIQDDLDSIRTYGTTVNEVVQLFDSFRDGINFGPNIELTQDVVHQISQWIGNSYPDRVLVEYFQSSLRVIDNGQGHLIETNILRNLLLNLELKNFPWYVITNFNISKLHLINLL